MKPLELTQEHKDKLLEMCNKLFPEYIIPKGTTWTEDRTICFIEDMEYGQEVVNNTLVIPLPSTVRRGVMGNPIYSIMEIHWFEFCMTHLGRKIFNSGEVFNDPVSDSSDGFAMMMFDQEWMSNYHPVDYLYEEFKKLSSEKV